MASMDYCLFENTAGDLDRCQEVIEAIAAGEKTLYDCELKHALRLIETCINITTLIAEEMGMDTLDELAYQYQKSDMIKAILRGKK